MKKGIIWNSNGWTNVQEADGKKHILGVMCFAEEGTVKEVRVRHHSGEEYVGSVTRNGEKVLPMAIDEFKTLYGKGELLFK